MLFDKGAQLGDIMALGEGVGHDLVLVQPHVQVMLLVQHIGYAPGHARGKVLACGPQNDAAASGHVLAAVVAHSLHHRYGAGVAHAEAFPGHAVYKGFAGGGAVKGHVAHDDVFPGLEGAGLGGIEHQLAAGEPFAEAVVAVSLQLQGEPFGDKGPEGLASAAPAAYHIAVLRQAVSPLACNL